MSREKSSSESTRILGIDPGLNTTGYGMLQVEPQSVALIEAGIVKTGSSRRLSDRLKRLYEGMQDVIQTLQPDVIALEELYSHYERPRTAILMGHARGVICLAASLAGVETHSYSATQIKRVLTGSGRAAKSQIQMAICRQLQLASIPEPPDVADALAIAICHHFLGHKVHLP